MWISAKTAVKRSLSHNPFQTIIVIINRSRANHNSLDTSLAQINFINDPNFSSKFEPRDMTMSNI